MSDVVTIQLRVNRKTRKVDMKSPLDRLETRAVIASVLAELDADSRAVSVVSEAEANRIQRRMKARYVGPPIGLW